MTISKEILKRMIVSEIKFIEYLQQTGNHSEHLEKHKVNLVVLSLALKGLAAEKLEMAIESIDKAWDTTNPANIVPRLDVANCIRVRNDSVAAGSITGAIYALELYRKEIE